MEQRESVVPQRSLSKHPKQANLSSSSITTSTSTGREPNLASSEPTGTPVASLSKQNQRHSDHDNSSSSVPSLRFPRPQGNKHLASWISSSDPNIMDLASENGSESGLAGSTFELITKEDSAPGTHNTDSESQDESQFDESISESVGSLDQYRQDDVQSLASTDQLEEEDHDPEDHESYGDDHDDASTAPYEEGSRLTEVMFVPREGEESTVKHTDDANEVSDAESHSSIEYTRQSLGTPSILTPESSRILGTAQEKEQRVPGTLEKRQLPPQLSKTWELLLDAMSRASSHVSDLVATYVPRPPPKEHEDALAEYRVNHSIANEAWRACSAARANHSHVFVGLLALALASFLLGSASLVQPGVEPVSLNITPESTTVVTTAASAEPKTQSQTSPASHSVHPTKGVALVPLSESHGPEWIWGYSTPSVSFTPQGKSSVLIQVEPSIPKTWTAQPECVKIQATRGDKIIPLNVDFSAFDSISVGFAPSEAHGKVQIKLSSKCRPKFEKSVKVHFGKGNRKQAVACMAELAKVFTGLGVWTERDAERCYAIDNVSVSVERTLLAARNKGKGMITTYFGAVPGLLDSLGGTWSMAANGINRHFEQAEKAFKSVTDHTEKPIRELRSQSSKIAHDSMLSAGKMVNTVASNIASGSSYAFKKASASQKAHQANLQQAISDLRIDEVQHQLRFGLLDAQVAAKAWWLKVTSGQDKSAEYKIRAKEFIAELHAFSAQDAAVEKIKPRPWKQLCQPSKGQDRGQKGKQQCIPSS